MRFPVADLTMHLFRMSAILRSGSARVDVSQWTITYENRWWGQSRSHPSADLFARLRARYWCTSWPSYGLHRIPKDTLLWPSSLHWVLFVSPAKMCGQLFGFRSQAAIDRFTCSWWDSSTTWRGYEGEYTSVDVFPKKPGAVAHLMLMFSCCWSSIDSPQHELDLMCTHRTLIIRDCNSFWRFAFECRYWANDRPALNVRTCCNFRAHSKLTHKQTSIVGLAMGNIILAWSKLARISRVRLSIPSARPFKVRQGFWSAIIVLMPALAIQTAASNLFEH
jgi:hypothetical protein